MWPGLCLGLTDGIHVSKTKEVKSRTDLNRWQVEWGREQPLAPGSWVVSSVCRVGKMSVQLIVTVSRQWPLHRSLQSREAAGDTRREEVAARPRARRLFRIPASRAGPGELWPLVSSQWVIQKLLQIAARACLPRSS